MADLKRIIENGDYYYFGEAPIHTTGVTLDTNEIKFKNPGETYQLTATITPAGAIEQSVIWSSSDETIATVDDAGLVTCVALGNATITVTTVYGGYTATCSVSEKIDVIVDFLLVGGGGAGGRCSGGGGGAGGVRQCCNYLIDSGSYTVTIGTGGKSRYSSGCGVAGGASTFNGITANGGGGGGGKCSTGGYGGSGGGGGCISSGSYSGGNGISGQGYNGGYSCNYGSGGGGGAGGIGCNGTACYGGMGGIGIQSDIRGAMTWYAGGGSGIDGYNNTSIAANCGGTPSGNSNISNATVCGAGGGGNGYNSCTNYSHGGNGIFILRYPTACGHNVTGGTKYTCGNYTIHLFASSGTLTVD